MIETQNSHTKGSLKSQGACNDMEKLSLTASEGHVPPRKVAHIGVGTPLCTCLLGSWPLLITSLILFVASTISLCMSRISGVPSSSHLESSVTKNHASNASTLIVTGADGGYHSPNVIYGHIHMAKTMGTTINGNLSMHYERICGHKGYSYDAYNTNEMVRSNGFPRGFSRGKVMPSIMKEIGYHDCDWISHENSWKDWLQFQNWSIPLELHVPCRDPVDHLMSQCNHRSMQFDCSKSGNDMIRQIDQCTLFIRVRYDNRLNDTFPTKCFNARRSVEYQDLIGERLQRKRIQADYVFRDTNKARQKEQECIWNQKDIQELVKTHLVNNYQYYNFCDQCIGSANDVFAHTLHN